MNKKDFIELIAKEHDLSLNQANQIVKSVFEAIKTTLVKGDTIAIPGFGGFKTAKRAERQGRNPSTGKPITIPESIVAQFKVATALKDALNEK